MKIGVMVNPNNLTIIPHFSKIASETEIRFVFYDDYEGFIRLFQSDLCDAVIIVENGAKGMETVRAAKHLCPMSALHGFQMMKALCLRPTESAVRILPPTG